MPVLDLTDEELQGFVVFCATASGPGINWTLTNALLNKARLAQEASKGAAALAPHRPGNSEDKVDAAVPRAT